MPHGASRLLVQPGIVDGQRPAPGQIAGQASSAGPNRREGSAATHVIAPINRPWATSGNAIAERHPSRRMPSLRPGEAISSHSVSSGKIAIQAAPGRCESRRPARSTGPAFSIQVACRFGRAAAGHQRWTGPAGPPDAVAVDQIEHAPIGQLRRRPVGLPARSWPDNRAARPAPGWRRPTNRRPIGRVFAIGDLAERGRDKRAGLPTRFRPPASRRCARVGRSRAALISLLPAPGTGTSRGRARPRRPANGTSPRRHGWRRPPDLCPSTISIASALRWMISSRLHSAGIDAHRRAERLPEVLFRDGPLSLTTVDGDCHPPSAEFYLGHRGSQGDCVSPRLISNESIRARTLTLDLRLQIQRRLMRMRAIRALIDAISRRACRDKAAHAARSQSDRAQTASGTCEKSRCACGRSPSDRSPRHVARRDRAIRSADCIRADTIAQRFCRLDG